MKRDQLRKVIESLWNFFCFLFYTKIFEKFCESYHNKNAYIIEKRTGTFKWLFESHFTKHKKLKKQFLAWSWLLQKRKCFTKKVQANKCLYLIIKIDPNEFTMVVWKYKFLHK